MPVQVRTRFDRLASDWKANLIYFQQGNTIKEVAWDALDETRSGMASPHATASRDDLLAYARSIGDRPPFLFSRERISRSGVGNNYADALRDTAIGILSAVDGRVSANTARFDNQRHSDMARDMPTQLVRAPDLMNADKARLTPIQRQLITEYQFRQDEVETWINNSRVPGNTDVRIAKSMLHRLQNQQKALRNLIEHWDE